MKSELWANRSGEGEIAYSSKPETVTKRAWDFKNPDKMLAYAKKRSKREKLKRAKARIAHNLSMAKFKAHNRPDKLNGEILRHHAKGRSIADIVVWMKIPASVVIAAIEKSK